MMRPDAEREKSDGKARGYDYDAPEQRLAGKTGTTSEMIPNAGRTMI